MFSTILSWLSGGIIGQIAKPLNEAYKAKLTAQNDSERLAADMIIRKIEKDFEAQSENRRITAGFWEQRLLSFLIGFCATIHFIAITIDTVFQFSWSIPKYPAPFDQYEGIILLSFFGVYALNNTVQTIAKAIIGKK